MSSLQEQARALGDPTRHQIFRYIADGDHVVDVLELTDHFGLNHNAIRQHLSKLVEAELVIEGRSAPSGRGRPRLTYTVNPGADSRWGIVGPYERLSLLLTEVIRTGDTPVEVGRRAGHRLRISGPDSGASATVDPAEEIVEQMARQGFGPVARRDGNKLDISLNECPFESSALADPDTVCNLHLGIALGIAESVGGIVVDELVPKDPRQAHCRLRCHVTD